MSKETRILIDPSKEEIDSTALKGIISLDESIAPQHVRRAVEEIAEEIRKIKESGQAGWLILKDAKFHDLRSKVEVKLKEGECEVSAVYTSEESLNGQEVCDIANKLLDSLNGENNE